MDGRCAGERRVVLGITHHDGTVADSARFVKRRFCQVVNGRNAAPTHPALAGLLINGNSIASSSSNLATSFSSMNEMRNSP